MSATLRPIDSRIQLALFRLFPTDAFFYGPIQTKTVQNEIFYKKVKGRVSLSPQGVELGDSKDLPFLKKL